MLRRILWSSSSFEMCLVGDSYGGLWVWSYDLFVLCNKKIKNQIIQASFLHQVSEVHTGSATFFSLPPSSLCFIHPEMLPCHLLLFLILYSVCCVRLSLSRCFLFQTVAIWKLMSFSFLILSNYVFQKRYVKFDGKNLMYFGSEKVRRSFIFIQVDVFVWVGLKCVH